MKNVLLGRRTFLHVTAVGGGDVLIAAQFDSIAEQLAQGQPTPNAAAFVPAGFGLQTSGSGSD
jgi:hypothetical protein